MKFLNLSLKKEIKAKELIGLPIPKNESIKQELKPPTISLPTEIVDEEVRITDVENLNIDSEQFETIPYNPIDNNNEIDSEETYENREVIDDINPPEETHDNKEVIDDINPTEEIHDNTSYEDKNEVADNTSANNNYDPNAGDVDEMDINSFFKNFADFANGYDPETGKFKDNEHFPNGIEDVYKYLNNNPDLAIQVLGAIANKTGVDLSDELKMKVIWADSENVQTVIDFLSSYKKTSNDKYIDEENKKAENGDENANPQDPDNKNTLAYNLENILATILEQNGNSDLLRTLLESGGYNNRILKDLIEHIDNRNNADDGNNSANVNGSLFDEYNGQRSTGDCWYLASLLTATNNEKAKEAIEKLITVKDGIYTVTIAGTTKSYTLKELGIADELSTGDADVRALEMAMRDIMAEGGYSLLGGSLDKFLVHFTGINDADEFYSNYNNRDAGEDYEKSLDEIKSGNYLTYCSIQDKNNDISVYDMEGNKVIAKTDDNGEEHSFVGQHAYAIVGADEKFVYIKNPWHSDQLLKISIEDFKKLDYQSVSVDKFNEWLEQSNEPARIHQEQMDYYNKLLASYGDKELTQEDINAIIAALKEKGIDYYIDILGKDNPNGANDEKNDANSFSDSSGVETVTTTDKNGNKTETQYEIINGKKVPTQIVITGKDGSVVTSEISYDDKGNVQTIYEYMTDQDGNTFEYKTDVTTQKKELVKVTNKKGESFVADDYKNEDGSINWYQVYHDGWGTKINGENAQNALRDLQNGASVEDIIEKYAYNGGIDYESVSGFDVFSLGGGGWSGGGSGDGGGGLSRPLDETDIDGETRNKGMGMDFHDLLRKKGPIDANDTDDHDQDDMALGDC